MSERIKHLSFGECVLYFSLFFVGIFHVYLSCALSIVLLIRLAILAHKNGSLNVCVDMTFIAVTVLAVAYLFSTIWAIDSGTAIFGFFKFLPLPLYALVLMQEPECREKTLSKLPYVVSVMTAISIGLMYIPTLDTYFAVSGRLSGFVQYPNAFAIILLVSELLLITKDRLRIWDYVCITLLLFGILYTGSRTVFLLAGASNLLALLLNKNKKIRWITLGCIALGIVAVLLYCLITDNFSVITRYLNISFAESTFIGRLLYAEDALPVILKHPFGLGYMGYYFVQQKIQSGVYSIMYIHNDFLQILLDVGFIPFGCFIASIVMTLINKKTPFRYKFIMLVLLAHCCFDFDLQYVAIFMMLLLFLTPKEFKTVTLRNRAFSFVSITAVLVSLCLFFGSVQALIRFEQYDKVRAIYDHDTIGDVELLKEIDDVKEANEVADKILKRNSYVAVAYSVKARYAYSRGDFANVIKYKKLTIEAAPFSHVEYWEYGKMLANGIKLYENAGDKKSAEICKKELIALSDRMAAQENNLSEYGSKISMQPIFYLTKELREYVSELRGEME